MRRAPLLALAAAAITAFAPPASADAPPRPRVLPPPQVVESRPVVNVLPRVEITDDGMQPLPTFAQGGRRFVLGAVGERYVIHIVNPTPARVEAVVSVDGLDAVDGRPASFEKRGYVIPAFGDVIIDGWRTSLDTVAAFRFSTVRDSFAARTDHARNVGVIGVAFFRERAPIAWQRRGWGPAPAPSAAAPGAGGASSRAGLGTQFGEEHGSHVVETTFVRAESSPMTVAELRYDDRQGLLARGIAVPSPRGPRWAENAGRDAAQPFPGSRFAEPPR